MYLALMLLLAQTSPTAAVDATALAVAAPTTVVVVDSDKTKGEPWRLAWSPDAQQLYLAAMKRKGQTLEMTHWTIDVPSGALKKIDAAPAWADKYWDWKSAQSAPGAPAFKIALDTQKKNEAATARPMGGAMARGGVDTGGAGAAIEDVGNQPSQNVQIVTMRLKGEIIGEWENAPIVPGLTFGWGPKGTNAIAFSAKNGHLVLMDDKGRKQEIETTKEARLPAWSDDGRQLAWAEKQDKKKYRIQVAGLTSR